MRPVHGAFVAFALSALAWPAAAAEISRLTSSGDRKDPFELGLSVRWERVQQRANIDREGATDVLRFERTQNAIVPRIAIGLWQDLELHAEMPYVLADDRKWRFGVVGGRLTGGVPGAGSSIEGNSIDADGQPCGATCQLFPVAPETTVYHGGRAGDLVAGLAWRIFNGEQDDTKPTWIVGVDVTFPTAALYEPGKERRADWSSPFQVAGKPGPFGEKVWKLDAYTVLSRRIGFADPYVKAHGTTMMRSSSTYSNCDRAAELEARSPRQMNSRAVENCALWGDEAGAQLPWLAGVTLGAELVPYENRFESQRVSIDLRVFADYTSSQRFYNELTDATGKLHQTGEYLTMGGLAGLYLRASKHLGLQATASLATRTAHYLTGESLGRDGSWPAVGADGITVDEAAMNPNFDWRYDAPGRRFRVSDVTVFQLGFAGVLQF